MHVPSVPRTVRSAVAVVANPTVPAVCFSFIRPSSSVKKQTDAKQYHRLGSLTFILWLWLQMRFKISVESWVTGNRILVILF